MDEINMIKAKARLEQSVLATRVYEEYEYEQEEAQKESDVDQATAERERVAKRTKAELETARADVASKQHQLASRNERLTDLREQLVHCIVVAPSDGLVVYAASLETHRWSRGDRGDLQVGSEVRKNELVMVLPDVSEMTAEVKVNEALSGLIETGQRVIITSDAVPDVALEGEVLSIGVLAESGGWRDPNRRDYTVKVLLTDTGGLGLKPSMRCKAEIYVGVVEDAIYVPLQAVFREGTGAYVYVPGGGGYAQRRVSLGKASGLYAEITTGLDSGETVLLREPEVREIVARLEDEPPLEGQAALGRPDGQRKEQRRRGRPPRG
jgi:multidrug efflux pump subunit AcrA (membrane-fusion protein)